MLKMPAALMQRVDNALAARHPMVVAIADADGQPMLSFRGSTQAFSDHELALWVRNADGGFMAAIAHNPKVALMYRDEDSRATFQFQGHARVAADQATRAAVYAKMAEAERNHDPARGGVAVIVELDRVEGWFAMSANGPVDRVRLLREA